MRHKKLVIGILVMTMIFALFGTSTYASLTRRSSIGVENEFIPRVPLSDDEVISASDIPSYVYTGEQHKPTAADFSVTFDNGTGSPKTLVSGSDFEIYGYGENKNAGTGYVDIRGINLFSGTKRLFFTIDKRPLSLGLKNEVSVTYLDGAPTLSIEDMTVTSSAEGTGFAASENFDDLSGDISFRFTNAGGTKDYAAGDPAGNYRIIPSGLTSSNYDITFEEGVLKVDPIASGNVTIDPISDEGIIYTSEEHTPTIVVRNAEGTVLVEGTDYDISYEDTDNVNAGAVEPKIIFKGNYSGTETTSFEIHKATLSVVPDAASITFGEDASGLTYSFTGFLGDDDDSVVSGTAVVSTDYTADDGVGNYTITVADGEGDNKLSADNYVFDFSGTGTLTVGAKNASSLPINDISALTYTGSAQTPALTIKDGEKTLEKGTDHTVSYTNNTNAGTATATVTYIGNYSGTATKTFTIEKATLNVVPDAKSVTYGENAPEYTYKITGFKGSDNASVVSGKPVVSSAYTAGSAVGSYDITVADGSGADKLSADNYTFNFSGKSALTVTAKDASSLPINDISALTYSGAAQTPALTIKDGSKTLVKGTDYDVSYSNNKNAGTATATVTYKGNYSGTASKTFTINKAALVVAADDKSVTYGSAAPAYTYTITGYKGSDTSAALSGAPSLSCTYSAGNAVGTYTITCTEGTLAASNYTFSPANGTLTVSAKSGGSLPIDDISALTYSGSAQTPALTIKDGEKTLTAGTDYDVSYSNNKDAGTATATVTYKGNYSGTATKTFTIKKAVLTVTADNKSATYGSAAPGFTYVISGYKTGDSAAVVTGTPSLTCTYSAGDDIGTYTISCANGTLSATNYTFSPVNGTLTVNAKSGNSLPINDISALTYSGAAQTPALTIKDGSKTLVAGTDYEISYSNNKNAGTATATVTYKGNYSGNASKTFTIQKATLTVTADNKSVTYGSSAPTYTASFTGFKGSDTSAAVSGTPSLTCSYSSTSPVGTYTITCAGGTLSASNYNFTPANGTLTVTAKSGSSLPINDISALTYSGSAQTPALTIKDGSKTLVAGTDYEVSYSNNKNAGTATATVTYKGNYSGTAFKTFTINKAALTVTAENKSVTYGDAAPTYTYKITGYKGSEDASVISGTPTLSCTYGKGNAVGDYTITCVNSTLSAANYTFTPANGTLTVNAKSGSSLPINDISALTYTGSAQTPALAIKDGSKTLVSGTDYDVSYSNNKDAGTATATVTYKGNYSGTATKTFTINKAVLTVTADNKSATYGSAAPDFTYYISGYKTGDTISVVSGTPSLTCIYSAGNAVGTYTITCGSGSLAASNYTFNPVNGTLTVSAKSGSSLPINDISALTYNGAAQTPALTIKDGEKTLVAGTDYEVSYSNNKDAGTATATVTYKGNYSGTASKTFTINKAELTIAVDNKSVTFGSAAPTYTYSITGYKGSDGASVLSGTPSITCPYTSASAIGSYTITCGQGTLSAANYTFKPVNATLTVTAAHDGVSVDPLANDELEYTAAAQTPAFVVKYGSTLLVAGVDYDVDYSDTDNVNVGTVKPKIVLKGNYSGTLNPEFSIVPAILAVTADDKTVTYGDAAPAYTYKITGFKGSDTSAVVSGLPTLSCNYAAMSDAGTYDITIADGSGSGALRAGNYTFQLRDGTLTVNKLNLSGMTIADVADQEYTGFAITPTPAVTLTTASGTITVPTADISYSYANNIDVGTNASVTATAKASSKNFTGSASKNFTIMKSDEPIVVIGNNGNATFMFGKLSDYAVGTTYTDNKGETTVSAAYAVPTAMDLSTKKSPLSGNTTITSADFDSSWASVEPTSLAGMFNGCSNLTAITNLDRLNMSGVTNTAQMFNGCSKLTELDLIGWDVSNLTTCYKMFYGCSNLVTIYGEDWTSTMKAATNTASGLTSGSSDMFKGDTKLVGAIAYDASKLNGLYANPTTGYFKSHIRPMVVIGANNNATFLVGDDRTYTVGAEYTDNLGATTVKEVYPLPTNMDTKAGGTKSPIYGNTFITSANFDASISNYHPTNLKELFYGCSNLVSITNTNRLDLSNVSSIEGIFRSCNVLTTIENISSWNTSAITNMSSVFSNCQGLQTLDLSNWNVSNVTTFHDFFYASSVKNTGNLNNWNVSQVTDMYRMFYNCSGLTNIGDISGWNVSQVTDMSNLFYSCEKLTSVGDLSEWNTASLEDMSYLFYRCLVLENVGDLDNWKTSKVTNLSHVFYFCEELTNIGDIGGWNVSQVTNMSSMFQRCKKLTSVGNLSEWNTSQVKNMSYMFSEARSLTELDLSGWDVSNVTDIYWMFQNCVNLTTIYGGDWTNTMAADNSTAESGYQSQKGSGAMFDGCAKLVGAISYDSSKINGLYANPTTGYFVPSKQPIVVIGNNGNATFMYDSLSNYPVGKSYTDNKGATTVKNAYVVPLDISIPAEAFQTAIATGNPAALAGYTLPPLIMNTFITSADFAESWATVKPTSLWGMFAACSNLKTITHADRINTSKVTDMCAMFAQCLSLESVDVSSWQTGSVTDMSFMFNHCSSIETLNLGEWETGSVTNMYLMFTGCTALDSLDLSEWETGNVTTMYGMFWDCSNLISLDLSDWNVGNVTDMSNMFTNCELLNTIGNLSEWETGNVTDMSNMFDNCEFTTIDLSNWDTSNVTNMHCMFRLCDNLQSVGDLSNWNTGKVTDMSEMFSDCSALVVLDLYGWDVSKVTNMQYMFLNCSKLTTIYGGDWTNTMAAPNNSTAIPASGVPSSYSMFGNNTKLVGAIAFNGGKINGLYANPTTGYFKAHVQPLVVIGANKNATFMVADKKNYTVGTAYRDNLGYTTVAEVYDLPDAITYTHTELLIDDGSNSPLCDNKTITKVNFDASIADWHPTSLGGLFAYCKNLEKITHAEYLDVSNVTDMSHMFLDCINLQTVGNISNWNVSNVTNMKQMFDECKQLTELDLSNWDISKVTSFKWMFYYTSNLVKIYASDWTNTMIAQNDTTNSVGDAGTYEMFKYSPSLVGAISYNSSKVNGLYANPTSGYFTPPRTTMSLTLNP